MNENQIKELRKQGYIFRPLGYIEPNDLWCCNHCARRARQAYRLMQKHGNCYGGYARGMILVSKYKAWILKGGRR